MKLDTVFIVELLTVVDEFDGGTCGTIVDVTVLIVLVPFITGMVVVV